MGMGGFCTSTCSDCLLFRRPWIVFCKHFMMQLIWVTYCCSWFIYFAANKVRPADWRLHRQ
jgi:hypothetical protein